MFKNISYKGRSARERKNVTSITNWHVITKSLSLLRHRNLLLSFVIVPEAETPDEGRSRNALGVN